MARDYSKSEVLDIIESEAQRRGIPKADFLRFAYIETGGQFDEQAYRGQDGAKGLFQFVPATARQYGILGRELDAVANTNAAASLYLDNRRSLVRSHDQIGGHYLSGKAEPDSLDMYMAHQQGVGGYRSIQNAIENGDFARSDTRGKILNNVSDADIKVVTGRTYAEFVKMLDKEMAKTFVDYWTLKFDRIRIPEKSIEPVTAEGRSSYEREEPANNSGISIRSAYDLSLKYDDVRYGFGIKNASSGKIDCSGWIVELQNATMEEVNSLSGTKVFGPQDKFSPSMDAASTIVQKTIERSGVSLTGSRVTKDALNEGMIIGEDNGAKGWDKGRYLGIDHIVMVVKNPNNGEMMISQSRGGEGVELTSVDDYLKYKHGRGTALYATDPLFKARALLQDKQQAPSLSEPGIHAQASPQHGKVSAGPAEGHKANGNEIRRIQGLLNTFGYYDAHGHSLEVDGVFGQKTRDAIQAFQQAHGLESDGVVGPATVEALKKAEHAPLLSNPSHPGNAMYFQAYDKLKQLDSKVLGFTNEHDYQNAAASLVFDARISGMTRIDYVLSNTNGTGLLALQGRLDDPAHTRVYVDRAQAALQPIEKSTVQLEQDRQSQQQQRAHPIELEARQAMTR